ncbi:alginate lyase family protein [Microvirga sp. BT689]|uniref:heparinase II/III family protein n=1 Tax=Microvirga arvi TaxID=2778731 RepID=UPI00194E17AF|nr:alginate lyase family protein [Microvirga arvi]MBM6582056.1 alginate lyase family protein [Microvirga arvi]
MLIDKFRWYVWRLDAMSSSEIAYRLREQLKRFSFRVRKPGWSRFDVGEGALEVLPALRQSLMSDWPDNVRAHIEKAVQAVIDGRMELLGQSWPAEAVQRYEPSLWFLDPLSGTSWPGAGTYCFDVDYRHSSDKGDVKFVWELNRLQFLHPLAALAFKNHDRELYARVLKIVLAWMQANPPFQGVNWPSGIELSMRLVTIAFVVSCAPGPQDVDLETRRQLRAYVAAHAFWLSRYPSLHSSANNHRVAEGLGLLISGLLCPDLDGADHYLKEGRSILASAPLTQFHSDGTGSEQSPTYAAFTIEMILLGLQIDSEDWLRPVARDRLVSAGRYLHALLDRSADHPRIGDDDEGRVIAMPPIHEDHYVASVLAGLASALAVPSLSPSSREPHLRDLLFRSLDAGVEHPDGVFNYPHGGYTIIRQHVANRSMILTFDHGPLGFLSIAAHGHSDALALWLHLDEHPILVDAGTYLYHSGGAFREHFRSTAAHNTLELGAQSQSLTAGAFNWRHKAEAHQRSVDLGEHWSITGSHDGYKARLGVEHERTIRKTNDGFDVDDRLIGPPTKVPGNIGFLVHPSIKVTQENGVALLSLRDGESILSVTPPAKAILKIVNSDADDSRNLYSAAFGKVEKTSAILIEVPRFLNGSVKTSFSVLRKANIGSAAKAKDLIRCDQPLQD